MENTEKVKNLNDELLDQVSGGYEDDEVEKRFNPALNAAVQASNHISVADPSFGWNSGPSLQPDSPPSMPSSPF